MPIRRPYLLSSTACRGLISAVAALTVMWAGVSAQPQEVDSDAAFCRGLRDRGLYSLAETYCLDELAGENLSSIREAELKLELARTYLAHAGQTLGDEQARLRQQAQDTVTEALESARGTRWGAELALLSAEIPARTAQFLCEESRLFPDDDIQRSNAIEALKKAVEKAREVEQDLERETRSIPARFQQNQNDISPFQHLLVRKDSDLLIAQLMCDLGEFQYPEAVRRGPAMRSVQDRIKTLIRGAEDEDVTWRARLLHLRTLRLLADRESFVKYQRDELYDLPIEFRDEKVAEEAELQLVLNKPDQAAALLYEYRKESGFLRGRLALTNLRALSALWQTARAAGNSQVADDVFERINSENERVKAEVGGVWAWRCARLRDALDEARRVGPELAAGMRQAKALYQSGDAVGAATEYGKLASSAAQQNRNELAAEMLFTQGSILLQLNQFGDAAPVFQSLFNEHPEAEQTPQAHLLWAYCLGKIYEAAPTQSNREHYTSALVEHLDRFPGTVTWGDAALMLGQLEERRLQVTKALEQYLRVPDKHPKAVAAHLAILRCYEKIFARLKELNQPLDAWQREGVQNLTSRVAAYPIEPEQLEADRVRVMLSLARLKLEPGTTQFDEADALLERAIRATEGRARSQPEQSATGDAARWQSLQTEAQQLRIISLASRGKPDEAAVLLGRLTGTNADDLLQLLSGLSRVAAEVDARAARGIAELQLQTTLALDKQRDKLTEPQIQKLDLCLAEAYAATAHSYEAMIQYEKILQKQPNSNEARRELAKLLMQCGRPDCYRRALEHWRKLEAGAKQGTSDWFALRKEVIESLLGTGQTDEASKLFRATELLYPDFGGTAIKTEYDRLRVKLPKK